MVSIAKRLFPGSKGFGPGEAKFPASKRIASDLNWFMIRYPLEIKNPEEWQKILTEARKHFEDMEAFLEMPSKVAPPPVFKGTLLEFQKEGLAFLNHNPRTLLADEMGLGKTPMALAWLSMREGGPPYLIVAQPHMMGTWRDEILKFMHSDSVHVIKGQTPYPLPRVDFYLIHYLLLNHWKDVLIEYDFHGCVFDEIQELRRAVSKKYSAASMIGQTIQNTIGLSGTPFYNYGGEIWNVLNILEFHCLGDYDSFSREWCGGYRNPRIENPEVFGAYLRSEGLFLRRVKDDVLTELPPKRRIVQKVDADYDEFDHLILPLVDQARSIPSIKDAWERGKVTMDLVEETRRVTGIAKAGYVATFVGALLEAGQPCILYGHHHDVMDIYMDHLKKYYPVMISGRQDATKKDLARKVFMDDGGDGTNLIIVSLRSGTGLNLQRAKCVVFGELDWSPAVHTQCEDRAHRIGVKDSVLCYYLASDAGTDPKVLETLGLKTSQFVGIMGDRPETEEDKMIAQIDIKKHVQEIIEMLQSGGRKRPPPSPEKARIIEYLEKMPRRTEPKSLDEFFSRTSDEEIE
jgi:SNF2 family DNA or RNA helicase